MSETAAETDTRFGTAAEHIRALMALCGGKTVVTTIAEAEPLGPALGLDALLVAPCTGNTLSKLAHGITDSAVTMAAKAHLRNGRPLVLAFSTNDALSGSAESIARLLNRKNVYFVPFGQDDLCSARLSRPRWRDGSCSRSYGRNKKTPGGPKPPLCGEGGRAARGRKGSPGCRQKNTPGHPGVFLFKAHGRRGIRKLHLPECRFTGRTVPRLKHKAL